MGNSKAEIMNGLFKKYGLNAEDHVFKHQHYTIITRAGIDQIQAQAGISIRYEVVDSLCVPMDDRYVVKATGILDDVTIETFGEVNAKNNRNSYPIAMAEKRAMSRAVLKLAGFYALGIFGEDEAEDFSKAVKEGRKAETLKPVIK